MDILELYQSYGIDYRTEGHKHTRPGWVNVSCPFCTGNPGFHLGATLNGNHFYCWRCGWKPTALALSKLLKLTIKQVEVLIREYGGVSIYEPPAKQIGTKEFTFPSGIQYLTASHKEYLESRNFDPYYIAKKWNILSTGPMSLLDGINYSHRILIPVYWDFQPVTFQARTVGSSPLKYLACPQPRELLHHKFILYGKPERWKTTGICVEGVTDVWRLGESAFATFGIEFTNKQLRLISKKFKRVGVMFDYEPQAQRKADELVNELRLRGVDAFKMQVSDDPGNLPQKEADYIVSQVI